MSAHHHHHYSGSDDEDLEGQSKAKKMRTMNGRGGSDDDQNLVTKPPPSSFGLLDWPSVWPPLGDSYPPSDQSFPIPDMLSSPLSILPTLDGELSLTSLSSPGSGNQPGIVIGPFVSVAPRNDAQRVWVGRSSTDPALLTITQGKKFKITISLTNNAPGRAHQLYCAIRSARETSLKLMNKQVCSGKIAPCDVIETEKTFDISFEHSTYLQAPLRLCFFILEPSHMLRSDDTLEKLEALDMPIFKSKAQTEEIEVITSTTWRNRYRPEGPVSSTVQSSHPAAAGASSSSSPAPMKSSITPGVPLPRTAYPAPLSPGGYPSSPLPISPLLGTPVGDHRASPVQWIDAWSNPVPWRNAIQSVQERTRAQNDLNWLRYCVGQKVALNIEQQSVISKRDFETIFTNLWHRVGPLDGSMLDGLYDQLFSNGWFCGFESDPFITSFLADRPIGSFLVRFSSTSGPDPFAYTLAVKTQMSPPNYFKTRITVDPNQRTYSILDDVVTTQRFYSLKDLITHHMHHPIQRGQPNQPPVEIPLLITTSLEGTPLEYGSASG
ncbi:MAG: SH2 domain-containing protein [archaeon]|nr:SH2 domain-containing protein [archaeon]